MNFAELVPVPFKQAFTTCNPKESPAGSHVINVPMGLSNLGITHETKGTPAHPVVQKYGKGCVQATFPKGSINPQGDVKGGFGFYLSGPDQKNRLANLSGAREVVFAYRVLFENGFDWVLGGKLPGIYGGIGDAAFRCTGGKKTEVEQCKCFNLRMMWRKEGLGELYAYLFPSKENIDKLNAVPPYSKQAADYGFSVGRGSFRFVTNQWNTISQRLRLNDPTSAEPDGELEIYFNGVSVIRVEGLEFRDGLGSGVKGMHFQSFFGGHTPEWASSRDQKAWFADITGAIVE